MSSGEPRVRKHLRIANEKIGRPIIKEEELKFKKKFRQNERRFQIESQLLVSLFDAFHGIYSEEARERQPLPEEVVREVFRRLRQLWIYQLLQANLLRYLEADEASRLCADDKLLYTSVVDVCYMMRLVHQEKTARGGHCNGLTTPEIFLVVLFYLHVEKLLNFSLATYFCFRLESGEFDKALFHGVNPCDPYGKITALLLAFTIEVLEKEKIPILRRIRGNSGVVAPIGQSAEKQGVEGEQQPAFESTQQQTQRTSTELREEVERGQTRAIKICQVLIVRGKSNNVL